jgi:hypothetical protein
MDRISFTVPYTPNAGSRTFDLCIAGLLTVGGILLTVTQDALWPLALCAVGLAIIVWLVRTQPVIQHLEYLAIGPDGIRYVHAPGQKGRISTYTWDEIYTVSADLAGLEEDIPWLSLLTTRPQFNGVPIMLQMPSNEECSAAQRVAGQWIDLREKNRQLQAPPA